MNLISKTGKYVFFTIIILVTIELFSYFILFSNNNEKPFFINLDLLSGEEFNYKKIRDSYFIYDATLGYRFKPKSKAYALTSSPSGIPKLEEIIFLQIDKNGLVSTELNKDIDFKPRKDLFTIIISGGSTVSGWGATENNKTWPALLEKNLNNYFSSKANKISSKRIRIINAGVFGYQISQEIKRFQEELIYLKPDLVILFNGINEKYNFFGNPVEYATHSKQLYMMNYFNNVLKNKESVFLPNTIRILHNFSYSNNKKFKLYPSDYYQMEYRSQDLYYSKVKQFESICAGEEIKFHFFLQPILGVGNKKMSIQESKLINFFGSKFYPKKWDEYLPELKNFYLNVSKLDNFFDKPNYHNLQFIFDEYEDTLYSDPRHYNNLGQKIIADKIFSLIKDDIIF